MKPFLVGMLYQYFAHVVADAKPFPNFTSLSAKQAVCTAADGAEAQEGDAFGFFFHWYFVGAARMLGPIERQILRLANRVFKRKQ